LGASRIIVHCGDYECGHSVKMYPALWADNLRLSDLEQRSFARSAGIAAPMIQKIIDQRSPRAEATSVPSTISAFLWKEDTRQCDDDRRHRVDQATPDELQLI
jgi:hypothetical protein